MIDFVMVRYEDGDEDVIEFNSGQWYYGGIHFDFLDQAIRHAHKEHEKQTEVAAQRKTISAEF